MAGKTGPVRRVVNRLLEICVDDPAGLAAAVAGGADRIELCGALALGGLTPSSAFVARAVATGVPIHAMVRPRAGDFAYDADECELMADDIARFAAMGVAGFVTGVALADGRLDGGGARPAASGSAGLPRGRAPRDRSDPGPLCRDRNGGRGWV